MEKKMIPGKTFSTLRTGKTYFWIYLSESCYNTCLLMNAEGKIDWCTIEGFGKDIRWI